MRHPPRILLVDDSPGDIELVRAILTAIPAELVVAETGADGIRRAVAEPFDAILLDILMPDMSGYEICSRLKARAETADIPIIFVTARNREEDILRGFEALAFDFVLKPFHPRELRARVQNALRTKSLLDELRLRVQAYERCLRLGRQLAQIESDEAGRQLIRRELDGLVAGYDAEGASYSLCDCPNLYFSGSASGRVAAEIPFHHAGLEGVFRLYRPIPCDPDECARIADFVGTLSRGIRRNSGLLLSENALSA